MKIRFGITLLLAVFGVGIVAAQGYDDIYYNPKKDKPKTVKKAVTTTQSAQPAMTDAQRYYQTQNYTTYTPSGQLVNGFDVDAYNRRGDDSYISSYVPADTFLIGEGGTVDDYQYTRKIQNFYNPTIIIESSDPFVYGFSPLRSYYYDWAWNWGWGPSWSWTWGFGPSWNWSWNWGWGPSWNWSWNWGWRPSWSWSWGWGWRPSWSWSWGWGPGWNYPHRPWWGPSWGNPNRPVPGGSWRPNNNNGRRPFGYSNSTSTPNSDYRRPGNVTTNRPSNFGYTGNSRPGYATADGGNSGGSVATRPANPGSQTQGSGNTVSRPGYPSVGTATAQRPGYAVSNNNRVENQQTVAPSASSSSQSAVGNANANVSRPQSQPANNNKQQNTYRSNNRRGNSNSSSQSTSNSYNSSRSYSSGSYGGGSFGGGSHSSGGSSGGGRRR